jgi:hypothetical protein
MVCPSPISFEQFGVGVGVGFRLSYFNIVRERKYLQLYNIPHECK